jgi:hypothetical protein
MIPESTRVLNRHPSSERGFEAANMKGQVMAEFAIVAPAVLSADLRGI